MPDIPLRPVSPTSAEARFCLNAYYSELSLRFGENLGPGSDTGTMAPPQGLFLVAGQAEPMGCVGLRGTGDGILPGMGEVKHLWIAPSGRQQGLARKLMRAIESAARDLGMSHLRLDTSRHLPEARQLYLREGWAEIARYNQNPHADHWFEKAL